MPKTRRNLNGKSRHLPKPKFVNSRDLRADIYREVDGTPYFRGARRECIIRAMTDMMNYGTKTRAKMDGGMNNDAHLYSYLTTTSRIIHDNNNNNSDPTINNNMKYKLEAPWEPKTKLVGADSCDNVIYLLETQSFNGYIFKIREEFVNDINSNGVESASMIISIGSSHMPQCIAAELSSESDYKVARMIALKHDARCTEYGELPGEGVGAKIMMSVMKKYMADHKIQEASLFDNAKKKLPGGKYQYAESSFYFLSRGEPYYHRYGFYPESDVESYIRAVIGMKKIVWNDIRESTLEVDILEKLESVALSYNTLLKYTDKAMQWFSAVWSQDPIYLFTTLDSIYMSIKRIWNLEVSIPLFWSEELCMNPRLAKTVKHILMSYSQEDSDLFYKQNVAKTICKSWQNTTMP
jgi:hypothetical protein